MNRNNTCGSGHGDLLVGGYQFVEEVRDESADLIADVGGPRRCLGRLGRREPSPGS